MHRLFLESLNHFSVAADMIKRLFTCFVVVWLGASLLCAGCKKSDAPVASSAAGNNKSTLAEQPQSELSLEILTEDHKRIKAMLKSEKLLLSLAKQVDVLNRYFQDRLGDLSEVFVDDLTYSGIRFGGEEELGFDKVVSAAIEAESKSKKDIATVVPKSLYEMAGDLKTVAADRIWAPILANYEFESCQLGTIGAKFIGNDFQTEMKFEGRFIDVGNRKIGVVAHQTLRWGELAPGQWRIKHWVQNDFEIRVSRESLFEDVSESAIPVSTTRQQVQSSSIETMLLANIKNANRNNGIKPPSMKYQGHADWESSSQYPGVSVVDIDRDGFDDLFVTDRWQSAQLLRNQGDGTFEDITETSGLNVERLCCCALFADFDNDGDSDAFVGGTLEPCQYFENVDGKFKLDQSLLEEYKGLVLVVSGAVADVNGDGLLDIYLCTYGSGVGRQDPFQSPGDKGSWSDSIVRPEDRVKMRLNVQRSYKYVDRGGPPNVLLLNDGGKLKRAKINDDLAQWHQSYQAVWADFDSDGDSDLFVCNDFAPDCFLRNETPRGSMVPKFVVATDDVVSNGAMCFGMGSHWGDFNNDGLLDLYVSNMYSKAGVRILSSFPDADERLQVSARGSFLYENQGGTFKQVAGLESGSQHVSKVGWSFGGQFGDFDNDGHLDIYVPSGFFTPPTEIQKPGDW